MVALMVIAVLIVSFFLIGGSYAYNFIFSDLLKSPEITFYPWGFLTVLTAVFSGFLKVYSSLLINQQKATRYLWINLLNFVFTMGISIALLFSFPYSLIGPMWGRLIPALISFLTVIYFITREYDLKFNGEFIKAMRTFCYPMIIFSFMLWVVNYIDRFVLQYFISDMSMVGVFDIAVKCTLVIEFLQGGLVNTIQPKVYMIWKDNSLTSSTSDVNKYYSGLSGLTLLAIPLFIALVPLLFPLFVKNELYYQIFAFFPILCLGFITKIYFHIFIAPIYFFKRTKVLPRVFLLSAICQIILSAILIKYFGIPGALWARFIVSVVQVLIMYTETRKFFEYSFNKLKMIYLPLFYLAMVIVGELIFFNEYLFLKAVVQLGVVGLLTLYVYRNEIAMLPIINKVVKPKVY
jgi:O-antigen/teichoic acid export membrane protein